MNLMNQSELHYFHTQSPNKYNDEHMLCGIFFLPFLRDWNFIWFLYPSGIVVETRENSKENLNKKYI